MPTVGRRPLEAEFIRHACRPPAEGSAPIAIGLFRRCTPGVGLRRREGFSRSAQADRRPQASGGRIHSARMPTAGRRLCADCNRPLQALRARRRPRRREGFSRSAQADHRPQASGGRIHSARMPTAGR